MPRDDDERLPPLPHARTLEPILPRFIQKMKLAYGDFSPAAVPDPTTWTPPPMAGGHRGRYLWTDAFGVVNFLTLFKETNDPRYVTLAIRLIETVHDILGRERDGSKRLGNATDEKPLRCGLRIGKVDESGPDGDGQYLHYLTVWMFALNRTSVATGDSKWNSLAISMVKGVYKRFLNMRLASQGRVRTYWKMSTDLSKPLVTNMGMLDAFDMAACLVRLEACARRFGTKEVLGHITETFLLMARSQPIADDHDPLNLGIGAWLAHWSAKYEPWAAALMERNAENLLALLNKDYYDPTDLRIRMAYREFGAVLGARCLDPSLLRSQDIPRLIEPYCESMMGFWEEQLDGQVAKDLRPITYVMMASAYIPG
ncbi:hypothetical protein KEM55_007000, partial [Ascosphaera atra]